MSAAADPAPPWTGWRALLMPAILAAGIGATVLASRLTPGRRFVSYPAEELAAVNNIHDYKGGPACQVCHPAADRSLAADPVALCLRCHPAATHKSHPLDAVQREPVGPEVRLGPGGRLACHTCHDPHGPPKGVPGLRLRQPAKALCGACHPGH